MAKRFEKSEITGYKFPKKLSDSTNEETKSSELSSNKNNVSDKNQIMLNQWKTIDNYYQKKMLYKINK